MTDSRLRSFSGEEWGRAWSSSLTLLMQINPSNPMSISNGSIAFRYLLTAASAWLTSFERLVLDVVDFSDPAVASPFANRRAECGVFYRRLGGAHGHTPL